MVIVESVFHRMARQSLESLDVQRTNFYQYVAALQASPGDFEQLMNLMILVAKIDNASLKDLKKPAIGEAVSAALTQGELTPTELSLFIITEFSKTVPICERQRAYSFIVNHNETRARSFIGKYQQEHMGNIHPGILVKLAPCFSSKELIPHIQEALAYLAQHPECMLSPKTKSEEIEKFIIQLGRYQKEIIASSAIKLEIFKTQKEMGLFINSLGITDLFNYDPRSLSQPVQEKVMDFVMRIGRLEQESTAFCFHVEPLYQLLESMKQKLLLYANESSEDIDKILEIARFLSAVDSTNRVLIKNALITTVARTEATVSTLIATVPFITKTSLDEESKRYLLELTTKTIEDVKNTCQLLGLNEQEEIESEDEDQVINAQIKQCYEKLKSIITNHPHTPIQPNMVDEIARDLQQIAEGFEGFEEFKGEDIRYQQVKTVANYLFALSQQPGIGYESLIVLLIRNAKQLESLLLQDSQPGAAVSSVDLLTSAMKSSSMALFPNSR